MDVQPSLLCFIIQFSMFSQCFYVLCIISSDADRFVISKLFSLLLQVWFSIISRLSVFTFYIFMRCMAYLLNTFVTSSISYIIKQLTFLAYIILKIFISLKLTHISILAVGNTVIENSDFLINISDILIIIIVLIKSQNFSCKFDIS